MILIEGRKYNFDTHDTALRIKTILGEHYSKFRTFGFIRSPYSRIVSSYHFYRNGKPITPGNKNPGPPRIRIAFARILPFKLWSLSYPYKSNIEHFVDENNELIVDFVGTFENLQEDLTKIFNCLNLDIPTNQLKHTNKSDHSSYMDYFTNRIFEKAVTRKIRRDLKFYEKYKFNL